MSPRERNLLIVLGAVAVAAGGFFLLTRGGEAPEEPAPTPSPSPPPAVTAPPPGPQDREPPPRALRFFGGRDPFLPLVVAEADGPGAEAPADVEAPPADAEPPPEDLVDAAPPGEEAEVRESVTRGGREVQVVDVFRRGGEDVVQVSVDGSTFVVGVGETFARNFRVVAISDPCATFLFGDERFTLCEPGERK